MRVTVTKRDIDKARQSKSEQPADIHRTDGHDCPIARAVQRIVRDRVYVFVGPSTLRCGRAEVTLPPSAVTFNRDFDAGRHCDPLTFQVDLP